jgi:hypothetical protein
MNVRVSDNAHQALVWMAKMKGTSMQTALDEAIEARRRQLLLEQANERYAELHANAEDGAAYSAELAALEPTLSDGLDETA